MINVWLGQEVLLAGAGDGFGAVGGAEFAQDRAGVKFGRAFGDDQAFGNLFVGQALGDQGQYFPFARREWFG